MRYLLLTAAVLSLAFGIASGDVARLTIGDVPRTYSHYLNARAAALCAADAAAGGLSACFLNPALITRVRGVGGHASARYNIKERNYLPGGDDQLDASDRGFLFSQAVAVRSTAPYYYGFAYSTPSYRSVEFSGTLGGELYDAEFSGGLRAFEVLLASAFGENGEGGVGMAAGIVSLDEEARVIRRGGAEDSLESAKLNGIAASFAAGVVYDVTDWVSVGLGHRLGSGVEVDGEWGFAWPDDDTRPRTGKSNTQPMSVVGVRVRPVDRLAVFASYLHAWWQEASSTLAAYPDPDRDVLGEALGTVALGAEFVFPGERVALRTGGSAVVSGEAADTIVPENSVGGGLLVRFQQYFAELSAVRERFELNGQSGQVVNYGIYATIGYDFF
jgi:hypothetical protein